MSGDNFHFDITGAPLALCLEVATTTSNHKAVKAVAWSVDNDGKRLVLYWTLSEKSIPLPAPLSGVALEAFVKSWLDDVEYGPEPDQDGHNEKGFRVYNEAWGHIGHDWQTFVAIEPAWIMYGK